MSVLVAFDLEGPLSPQDNAYEVMGCVPRGYELFERLSRYDDILALRGREDYEPGDTLMLLVPFLLANGLCDADVTEVSARAAPVPGAAETVQALQGRGVPVVIISTSYCQHAHNVADCLGVPRDRVACTRLSLDDIRARSIPEDRELVLKVQERLLSIPPSAEEELTGVCDAFFWSELPNRPLGRLVEQVKVVGGARKTAALYGYTGLFGVEPGRVIAVGDSITDFKMLTAVEQAGGLAIVFNGNEYALPYGTCGVAASDLRAVLPLVEAFIEDGRRGVRSLVEELASRSVPDEGPVYHWLSGAETDKVILAHKKFRRLLRGRAAKLG
ncbi:MAG: haloacid dehalogenase-like hydrolase [Bacillota bacterium]